MDCGEIKVPEEFSDISRTTMKTFIKKWNSSLKNRDLNMQLDM